jgi:hypothetical protein
MVTEQAHPHEIATLVASYTHFIACCYVGDRSSVTEDLRQTFGRRFAKREPMCSSRIEGRLAHLWVLMRGVVSVVCSFVC